MGEGGGDDDENNENDEQHAERNTFVVHLSPWLPIGERPTMETVRRGMQQIGHIQREICSSLTQQVQKAATSEMATSKKR